MTTEPISKSAIRLSFFELLLQDYSGWLCIALKNQDIPKVSFAQYFFEWPDDHIRMEEFILKSESQHNIYFCPHLLDRAERKKDYCLPTDLLWADLDEVNPDDERNELLTKLRPPIVLETSPKRYQAFWRLSDRVDPQLAEVYSRRLAYAIGADNSGWDLTQLFRVPFTKNFKYTNDPYVLLERALQVTVPIQLFDSLPQTIEEKKGFRAAGVPLTLPDPDDQSLLSSIIAKYRNMGTLRGMRGNMFEVLFYTKLSEKDDWSKVLWRFIHTCLDAGMNIEDAYVVAWNAGCNKYKRDNRREAELYSSIQKAYAAREDTRIDLGAEDSALPVRISNMVTEPATETFIDVYRDWAIEATDAIPEFHELCGFVMLSAIVSNSVRINTSHGIVRPNIWGMILGDSTLTRKTTAMNMATSFLTKIDPELIVATEGSIEGLLGALSTRPNKTSIFHRDEISGFFEAIKKKDYLAGMMETLAALYDVPPYFTRRLRKEVITIESPSFIFLAGGVRNRVFDVIQEQDIISGFIPRFLVVSGYRGKESLHELRPTGPLTDKLDTKRSVLQVMIADLYENYAADVTMKVGGEKMQVPPVISAIASQDAWERFTEIERGMLEAALDSSFAQLALPTMDRMSKSILKMAVILAASRQEPKDGCIGIDTDDVINAAYYGHKWSKYSIDLIMNAEKTYSEKKLEKVHMYLLDNPQGVTRSKLMKDSKLMKRDLDEIVVSLEDRGLIRSAKVGGTLWYYAIV